MGERRKGVRQAKGKINESDGGIKTGGQENSQ